MSHTLLASDAAIVDGPYLQALEPGAPLPGDAAPDPHDAGGDAPYDDAIDGGGSAAPAGGAQAPASSPQDDTRDGDFSETHDAAGEALRDIDPVHITVAELLGQLHHYVDISSMNATYVNLLLARMRAAAGLEAPSDMVLQAELLGHVMQVDDRGRPEILRNLLASLAGSRSDATLSPASVSLINSLIVAQDRHYAKQLLLVKHVEDAEELGMLVLMPTADLTGPWPGIASADAWEALLAAAAPPAPAQGQGPDTGAPAQDSGPGPGPNPGPGPDSAAVSASGAAGNANTAIALALAELNALRLPGTASTAALPALTSLLIALEAPLYDPDALSQLLASFDVELDALTDAAYEALVSLSEVVAADPAQVATISSVPPMLLSRAEAILAAEHHIIWEELPGIREGLLTALRATSEILRAYQSLSGELSRAWGEPESGNILLPVAVPPAEVQEAPPDEALPADAGFTVEIIGSTSVTTPP